jgi:hypothetical protein
VGFQSIERAPRSKVRDGRGESRVG